MVCVAVFAVGIPAAASTITFDNPIEIPPGAPPPQDEGVGFEYDNFPFATPSIPDAFFTQGYAFGGRTGVPSVLPGPTEVGLGLIYDPSVCPLLALTNCIDNGTDWLGAGQPFSLIRQGGVSNLALFSFQASQVWEMPPDPILCPPSEADCQNAVTLEVYGLRGGVVVAFNSFALSYGFQTFALTDPEDDWANVARVVFNPLSAPGQPGVVAVDNILVPEPTSLTMLATGLLGVTIRRRQRRV
jgi:hypothetical protein